MRSLITKIKGLFGASISDDSDDVLISGKASSYPADFSEDVVQVCEAVAPYTMTSVERIHALVDAVTYIVKNNIDGAFVECGVWKGGSAMAMAMSLASLGQTSREIVLFDTFSGMSAPTDEDVTYKGDPAQKRFDQMRVTKDSADWCCSPVEEVRQNVLSTGYPKELFRFVEGKVEDTIPAASPTEIALLRLDTDWYESTRHEMEHLFPLLKPNGVLIIDDYGHWKGARKAVDEYFKANNIFPLFHRIDYTARMLIKL